MFVIETLESVLKFVQEGKANYFPSVKTIDTYKGQLSDAMKNKAIIKLADPLPAVYIVLIDDYPIADVSSKNVDLLICADSKSFNKSEKQTAAYTAAGGIAKYIDDNQGWQYGNNDFMIDKEVLKVSHLMTDEKYTILSINLSIKNLK